MRYAMTHGERQSRSNPKHTYRGLISIDKLMAKVVEMHLDISMVVCGFEGARFLEMENIARTHLYSQTRVVYSPFCGLSDSTCNLATGDLVVLKNGVVIVPANYVWIPNPAFDAWNFVSQFPENTMFACGRPFLLSLGEKSKKASVYSLDSENKKVAVVYRQK